MAVPRLQLVAATPGGASLREILSKKRDGNPIVVTAFSSSRLRAAKEVVGEADDVDFIEFGGLVGQFLALGGGAAGGLPARGHIEAAISLACEALPPESVFHPVAKTAGFQARVARSLDKLRGYGMEGVQLLAFSKEAEPDLAAKLEGLAFIQTESARTLDLLGKRFNSERIRQCIELPADVPFNAKIILIAGCEDEPTNLGWIPWATEAGAEITIIVDAHPTDAKMFEGGSSIAKQLGLASSPLPRSNTLTSRLFATVPYAGTPAPLDVQIFAMPDPLSECEWTLRAALDEMEAGTPAEQIGIVVRRMEEYAPCLEACAIRLGVTLSVTRTMPLLAAGLPKFLLDLIESLAAREPARFGRVLRSTYFGLSADDRVALDDAFREARLDRGDPWRTLSECMALHKERFPLMGQLLLWRTRGKDEPATLADWVDRLRDLGELPWLQKVFEGNEPTCVRDRYAMNVLQRCVAEIAAVERVRRDLPIGLSGFVRVCRERWEREDVAIPRGDQGVAVVSSAGAIGNADVVFVLGMLEGVFPRRRSEDPILTDDDLAWLSSRIERDIPDSHRRAREERDEFFRVCSAPSRRLVLSYPQSGDDKDNVKAFYLTEVETLIGQSPIVLSRRQWVPEPAVAHADKRLRDALASERAEPLTNELKTEAAQALVRRKAGDSYQLRDLQRVLECPFRYAVASKLGVHSYRPQSRWNRLLGLPEKVNLPATPDPDTARRRLADELESLLAELYGETTPEDLAVMRLGGRRLIGEWVEREFRARDVWKRAAAQPDPKFDEELRSRFKTRDGQEIDLKGKFAGLSHYGEHRVLNLFMAHEPYADARAQSLLDRFHESDKFYFGMALASIRDPKRGIGLEVDTGRGERRLILSPRPLPPPNAAKGLEVTSVDEDERREWIDFVESQCRKALARLNEPSVSADPGEHCQFCDMGELCRRSKQFSELGDPFEEVDAE